MKNDTEHLFKPVYSTLLKIVIQFQIQNVQVE